MSTVHKLAGVIQRVLGNNQYEVAFDDGKHTALCYLSGKMCMHKINVVVGDVVHVDLPPPYDRGRITFREKGGSGDRDG